MVSPKPPVQGQVLKLNLDPTLGHEQKGYRPVLVVSATLFNSHTGFSWVIPITTPLKGLPNEVRLPEGLPVQGTLLLSQLRSIDNEVRLPEGLPVQGTLLLSQLRSIDWRARPFSVACSVPAPFLEDINARLSSVLVRE